MKPSTIKHIRDQAVALQAYARSAKAEANAAYSAASNVIAMLDGPNPDFGSFRTISILEACETASRAAIRLDTLIMAAYLDSIDET